MESGVILVTPDVLHVTVECDSCLEKLRYLVRVVDGK